MKFKKFLIIILSVALLSCFAVSTFATDATTAATIPEYGFYISPGDYVFNSDIDFSMLQLVNGDTYDIFFSFSSFSTNYSQLHFNKGGDGVFALSYISPLTVVYDTYDLNGWLNQDYRYITVLDGFYLYNINDFLFWSTNLTRVDSGYDDNLLDGILSSFTFIGEWIAGAANAVTPMFWDGESLTVVGTLSVSGLSFAVVFLLIALVSSFMKFRS